MKSHNKVGLVCGALLGGWHGVWAILVAIGLAQAIYDFVLWAHMIHLPITIGPFDLTATVTLIVITAIAGYVMGYVGSWVWNKMR